jgi:SAM-dependent methyltransferase
MNEYDLIAPFYDIEHAHFNEDLDMYYNFAEVCGGKILELACGSGRALLPLAQAGYELTGTDTSLEMLKLARQRLEMANVADRCKLVQQDMVNLHLEQNFRMAFIALGSFAHITSRAAQLQALQAIRTHLSPGGLFILDNSNADARYMEDLSGQVLHQGTWRIHDEAFLTHFVSPAASSDKHLLELTHFYEQHRQGGSVQRTVVTTYLYLFERTEIELLVERAGFTVKDVYGDHELGPYQLESPRLILVAEAN